MTEEVKTPGIPAEYLGKSLESELSVMKSDLLSNAGSRIMLTPMEALTFWARLAKVAEKYVSGLQEEAEKEFLDRIARADEKTINVGLGNFKRNGVINVWTYSTDVQALEKQASELSARVKEMQEAERATGVASCKTLPPKKAFALSV